MDRFEKMRGKQKRENNPDLVKGIFNCESFVTTVRQDEVENIVPLCITPTSTKNMFLGTQSPITELDFSHTDLQHTTDMSGMFANSNLTSIKLNNKIGNNITSMKGMFQSCVSLTNVDISNFQALNLKDMSYMFDNSNKWNVYIEGPTVNMSGFIAPKITSFTQAFAFGHLKGTLDLRGINFDPTAQISMYHAFEQCRRIGLYIF